MEILQRKAVELHVSDSLKSYSIFEMLLLKKYAIQLELAGCA